MFIKTCEAGLVLSITRILRAAFAKFFVYVCMCVCLCNYSSQTTEPICIKIIPANRASDADCYRLLRFEIFTPTIFKTPKNPKGAWIGILKLNWHNIKTHISRPRFERFLRNLAHWCTYHNLPWYWYCFRGRVRLGRKGSFWCATCKSVNRTCSTSLYFCDDISGCFYPIVIKTKWLSDWSSTAVTRRWLPQWERYFVNTNKSCVAYRMARYRWPLVTLKATFAVWNLSISHTSENTEFVICHMLTHESNSRLRVQVYRFIGLYRS